MPKDTQELHEILEPYISVQEALSLLTLNLYEVYDGARKFIPHYERLSSLPEDRSSRRDALIDILVDMKVLIEDVMYHAKELHEQIDKGLDEIDPEDE